MPIQTDWLEMSGRKREERLSLEKGPEWATYLAWAEAFDCWLDRCKPLEDRTRCKKIWHNFLSFCQKFPWQVTPLDVEKWVELLRHCGRSEKTIDNARSLLASFYKFAKTYIPAGSSQPTPLATTNPVVIQKWRSRIAQQRDTKTWLCPPGRPLAPEEVLALFAYIGQSPCLCRMRDDALFLTCLVNGFSPRVILSLRWGDIEEQREVGPDGQQVWARFGWEDAAHRQHTGWIPRRAWETLGKFQAAYSQAILAFTADIQQAALQQENYLFPDTIGLKRYIDDRQAWDGRNRPLSLRLIRSDLQRHAEMAGLQNCAEIGLLAFRHTNIVLRAAAGQTAEEIQGALVVLSLADVKGVLADWHALVAADWGAVWGMVGMGLPVDMRIR